MASEEKPQKQPSSLKSFIAGGVGGSCLVLVGHPLDTVKVKLQTMKIVPGQPPPYAGVADCVRKTVSQYGVLGLYRGMAAPLAGVAPMYALCFFGYSMGKKIFCKEDSFQNLDLVRIALAGATSAAFTTPILAPGERAKCLLQVQTTKTFAGPMDVAKYLYKTGGLASVNRGFCATFLRDGLGSLLYFSSYEYLKVKLTDGQGKPSIFAILMAGGVAGMLNWLPALPVDTLKTRLQVDVENKYKHGIRSVFVDLIKTEGPLALYRGFSSVMLRAFPANAACFLGYEGAIRAMDWLGLE